MALDAGSVYATLGGRFNPSGFLRFDGAMKGSGKNVKDFENSVDRSMKRSGRALSGFGRAATQAAGLGAAGGILALTAAVAGSVKKAADFEQQLSSLASVTNANGRTMERFKKQALDAGAATKYSALQAAQAQTELAKGGLSARDILGGGLKGALALAAAGELDLADAAAYTVNALNLFGLSGKDATHVADALAQAANATTADVGDFGLALSQGGSAAKAAGLSFDETVASLEALASIGIKGSDAGTSLKAALTQLASPTKKAQAVMDDLNLSFFDGHGKMKSVVDIAAMLDDKLGGLTKQQRLQAATTLVGTDGMRALLSLYDAGPAKIKGFEDGLAKQGTAAEVAAKKQDNLKGKLENLKGSVETAAIVFGTELIPVLQKSAEDLTNWVNKAAASGDIKRFGQDFANGLKTAIGYVPTVIHGIQEIGSTAGSVIGTVVDVVNAFGGFGTVAPALLGAAAGLLAFRGLSAVVPVVMSLSTAIGDVVLAARAGGAAFAFETLVSMINPVTAVAGAFALLGGAVALLASQESTEEGIARRAAEAKRDQKRAVDELRDAELANADAGLAAQRADIEHTRAVQNLAKVRRDSKSSALDIRDAELQVRETAERSAAAQRGLAKATGERIDKARKEIDVAQKRADTTQHDLDLAKHQVASLEAQNGAGRAGERAYNRLSDAVAAHAAALKNLDTVNIRAGASLINYLREVAGAPALHKKDELAVQDLFAVYSSLPKQVITKLLAAPEDALAKIASLSSKLEGVSNKKTVAKILAEGGSAEATIERLRAKLASLHDKNITITTTTRTVGSGSTGRGSGAGSKGHVTPKVVAPTTPAGVGGGLTTSGPTLAVLGDGDPRYSEFVIPTEPRYRGRGVDLWLQAAMALGIPGFKAGVQKGPAPAPKKKPPKRYVPPKLDPLRLPVDAIEHASDVAKGKYDDESGKVKTLESSIASDKKTANQKATKYNGQERAQARRRLTKEHAEVKRAKAIQAKLKAIWQQRHKEAASARDYQSKIDAQEALVELYRGKMDNADKRDDQSAFDDAKTKRGTALTALQTLIADAQKHVKDGSTYFVQLEQQLTDIEGQQLDNASSVNDPETTVDPTALSAADQKALDAIEKNISLDEVTGNVDQEKTDVGALETFWRGILSARQAAGAPDTAITAAAQAVKNAHDELVGLTPGGTAGGGTDPDLQAQLDQANARAAVSANAARLSEAALGVFGPAGSDGSGGAQTVHNYNFQSLVPPSRQQIEDLGRMATDGQGSQGFRSSGKTVLPV